MNGSTSAPNLSNEQALLQKAVEISVRLSLVAVVVVWCVVIFRPFIIPILWAVIIAVALFPVYAKLKKVVGGKDSIAGTLFVLVALAILIVPTYKFTASIVDTTQTVTQQVQEGTLNVPSPRESVRAWPFVGERLYDAWLLASQNLQASLERFAPQLRELASRALGALGGLAGGVLQSIIAIIIAGFMLAHTNASDKAVRSLFTRLAGDRGEDLVDITRSTIRSVAQGVLGVAIIQALLGGIGLVFADVPGAGIWVLLILILAIMQLPPLLVLGPAIIYVFSANESTTVAVIFAIWGLIVSVSDTFLKPMFLGRGVDIPMPVILIGAIGGMIAFGIIGLFVGAVVLAIGYRLFKAWMAEGRDPVEAISRPDMPKPDTA